MSIEYAPLATEDESANDYKSIYSYNSVHEFNNDSNYKSVFKYSKKAHSHFGYFFMFCGAFVFYII